MPLSSRTCELSTDDAYAAAWTLCREASPARTSPTPASGPDSRMAPAADSGPSSSESYAKFDPGSGFWLKMSQGFCQLMMGGALEEFSETWPRSGLMRSGSCYPLPTLAPRTCESESGLWPTPTSSQARSEGMILQMRAKVDAGEISREEAELLIGGSLTPPRMKRWPTPRANDAEKRGRISDDPRNGLPGIIENMSEKINTDYQKPLPGEESNAYWERMAAYEKEHGITPEMLSQGMAPWPTPTARDGKGTDAPGRQGGASLCEAVRKNPLADAENDGPGRRQQLIRSERERERE